MNFGTFTVRVVDGGRAVGAPRHEKGRCARGGERVVGYIGDVASEMLHWISRVGDRAPERDRDEVQLECVTVPGECTRPHQVF